MAGIGLPFAFELTTYTTDTIASPSNPKGHVRNKMGSTYQANALRAGYPFVVSTSAFRIWMIMMSLGRAEGNGVQRRS